MRRFRPYFEPDDGANPQGGAGKSDGATASFQRLLERKDNDALKLAQQLFDENWTMRGQKRDLEQQLSGLQGKLPDGAVVLSGDDAKAWQGYVDAGKPNVKELSETVQAAQGKLTKLERDQIAADAAAANGFDAGKFRRLLGDTPLIVKDVSAADGKTEQQYLVTQGDKEQPVAEHFADFAASLRADGGQGSTKGVPYPPQRGNVDGAPPKSLGQSYVDRAYRTRTTK